MLNGDQSLGDQFTDDSIYFSSIEIRRNHNLPIAQVQGRVSRTSTVRRMLAQTT